jgi:hypothetical protein
MAHLIPFADKASPNRFSFGGIPKSVGMGRQVAEIAVRRICIA